MEYDIFLVAFVFFMQKKRVEIKQEIRQFDYFVQFSVDVILLKIKFFLRKFASANERLFINGKHNNNRQIRFYPTESTIKKNHKKTKRLNWKQCSHILAIITRCLFFFLVPVFFLIFLKTGIVRSTLSHSNPLLLRPARKQNKVFN